MSIRRLALRWLATTHGVRDADIFTSRYYPAEQSWTGRDAWWVQVPVHRVQALGAGVVHLVCEGQPGGPAFHYLRVPAAFLREQLADFDVREPGPCISLFLSADPDTLYRDERGPGSLEFAPFAVGAERDAPA